MGIEVLPETKNLHSLIFVKHIDPKPTDTFITLDFMDLDLNVEFGGQPDGAGQCTEIVIKTTR